MKNVEKLNVVIPEDVKFSDLRLERDYVNECVTFDDEPIIKILKASGIEEAKFRENFVVNSSRLITVWYKHHIINGGKADEAQEKMMLEADYLSGRFN